MRLLDELETEARHRAEGLEAAGRLPAGFTSHHYPLTANELRELRRLKACAQLAPDADTYVALARGRAVPRHRLNASILAAHERRIRVVR